MTTITKSGSKLTVGAMNHESKNIAKRIFDLKDHKGERIRVHIDTDGKYTIGTNSRQKLLICEIDIPEKSFESEDIGTLDLEGKKIYRSVQKNVELSKVLLKTYSIPMEVEK